LLVIEVPPVVTTTLDEEDVPPKDPSDVPE
jgi:hypothetical protein